MKNTYYGFIVLIILLFGSIISLNGQDSELELIKNEIMEQSKKEMLAFKDGDCDTLGALFDENASLYLNGRKAPGKMALIKFCENIQRPFEKPSKMDMEYIPINESSAFVIRTMEFSKDGEIYKKEIVTKIWQKKNNCWKIIHLHSTITEL